MYKLAMIRFFNYVLKKGWWKKVLFCIPVYDESNIEAPEDIIEEAAQALQKCMESAGVYFCPNAPLKTSCDIGDFWIHE